MRCTLLGLGLSALLALMPQHPLAQGSGVPRPGPVETAPLSPPSAAPEAAPRTQDSPGGVTLTQEPPAAPGPAPAPAPVSPAAAARPTLLPAPGDPHDVKEVALPAKPAAMMAGESTWDEGLDKLKQAFATLEGELARAGIRPAGRPITLFLGTDDAGFRYEAMVPVDPAGAARLPLSAEIRYGRTPEGRAYHFVHRGPYEDIDSTYETITAYLDAKGIVAKDVFIEEYVTDLSDSTDDSLEINIFVQPR